MRKVTCASCGRPYDYDSDDFCPKCGSYNPPPDRAGARPAQATPFGSPFPFTVPSR